MKTNIKARIFGLVIAALLPALSQAAPSRGDRQIEPLARELEAQGDALYDAIKDMIPNPKGLVKDMVNRFLKFENSADHFRNEVVDEGAYSEAARRQFKVARNAWQNAQEGYQHLPKDRRLTSYRRQINSILSELNRIYNDDRGNNHGLPSAELVSLSAGITARSEQVWELARDEKSGDDRFNRNTRDLGIGRFSEVRTRAKALERSVRQRPYRDPEVRRNLQDLQDAYARGQRASANFSNRVREQYRQLGQSINRFQRLMGGRQGGSGGQYDTYPTHGGGYTTPVWHADNIRNN